VPYVNKNRDYLQANGWREAISCRNRDIEIDTYNPILSGLANTVADASQDGYFTAWPDNSTILLRGTTRAEGKPVMISYPYGQGRVVAASLYPDWANGMEQVIVSETAPAKDLVVFT